MTLIENSCTDLLRSYVFLNNYYGKALEFDPDYELALINKAFTERLEEGEKLNLEITSVAY